MNVTSLIVIFLIIVLILNLGGPLQLAIIGGIVATSVFYSSGVHETLTVILKSATSWSTLSILLIFYLITFLQRMLEKRGALRLAEKSLDGLFNNRRVNASLAPIFIGLLPSAGAVTLCGAIVDAAGGDRLTAEEKTLITSYFRHIPESFLPTYSSILIGVGLSGVPLTSYLAGMIPMVLALVALGYFFFLRKLPRETGQPPSTDRMKDFANLMRSFWTVALIVALIIVFRVPVYAAVPVSIILNVLAEKFSLDELLPMIPSAFEMRLLSSTGLVLIFKDVLAAAGVIETLPLTFESLPIPGFLTFFLIFFFGSIVSGQMSITAICMPIAFATIPDGGMPLLVLLLSAGYIAMQISPTHVCLAVVTEYFHTNMGTLIRMTLPVVLAFCAILLPYYLLLGAVMR